MDGKHVVFGEVLEGMDVVTMIENTPTNIENNRPETDVVILDCVEVEDPDKGEKDL